MIEGAVPLVLREGNCLVVSSEEIQVMIGTSRLEGKSIEMIYEHYLAQKSAICPSRKHLPIYFHIP